MKYEITHTELTCINILIRTIQEAIERDTFDENEIKKIIKTINKLNERSWRFYRFILLIKKLINHKAFSIKSFSSTLGLLGAPFISDIICPSLNKTSFGIVLTL